jgi:hypothetical protein
MTGFTKKELDQEYTNYKSSISNEDLQEKKKSKEPAKNVNETEKKQDVELKNKEVAQKTALDKFNQLDSDEKVFFQKMVKDLSNAVQGAGINKDACKESMPRHIYAPLSKEAENFCKAYDEQSISKETDPEQFKKDMTSFGITSAEKMFQAAFRAFGAINPVNNLLVFGEMSLKNRIISAQKVTDVMLNKMTPVGFDAENFGQLAKGSFTIDHPDKIRDFIKANFADKYNDKEIDTALTAAKKDFGALYRGERAEVPEIFQMNYRPNIDNFKLEGKALNEVLKLVNGNNPIIKDEALKDVINENVRRYKAIKDEMGSVVKLDVKAKLLKTWDENEKKFGAKYPNYNPKESENLVNATFAQMDEQKGIQEKLQIELNEPKAQMSPPVDSKTAQINALDMKK